jgi:hypothetical protein
LLSAYMMGINALSYEDEKTGKRTRFTVVKE